MERTKPVAFGRVAGTYEQPQGPVYIVNGAAGQDFLAKFRPLTDWIAWRENFHGFGRLSATKDTLKFEFVEMEGRVLDGLQLKNYPSVVDGISRVSAL
jgi:hypothetical protein